jgi:L-idonate 5-dehydrogenase
MLATGNVPLGKLLAREIELVGTFRFDREFAQAVRLLEENRINVRPLITAEVPLREALGAFDLASHRNESLSQLGRARSFSWRPQWCRSL